MLSSSSETIIFMFLGVATIHDEHDWNWWFVILTIVFCTFFRCLGVLLLCGIANQKRLHKLGAVDQFVMMYGGLRGAVAFALVLLIDPDVVPHAHMFVTTTIAVVYWTVFVQGITIKPLVKFLNVKTASEKEPTMNERITGRFMDHIISGMEGILGEFGNLKIRDMYRQLDIKYIKPCLLRENKVRDPKIIETYETITNNEMVEYIKKNPSNFHIKSELNAAKSVSQLLQNSMNMENVDLKEIHFNQSKKDITEAKIHHLLSETMEHNKKTLYSRHNVIDDNMIGHYKYNNEKKKKKRIVKKKKSPFTMKKNGHLRVAGSEKTLQDENIHKVMANVDLDLTCYEDLDGYINFIARNPEKDVQQPPSKWQTESREEKKDSKDYIFFNRRESQGSLNEDNEGKKVSRQINDIDFLNALSNRRFSNSRRSNVYMQDPEFLPLSTQTRDERTRFHYENDM